VFALAALVLIGVSVSDLLRDKPYNVILLTVDSLRSVDFNRETAPHFFDAMDGAAVPNTHRTISAWTAPNTIAILTGLSPVDQGVHDRGQWLPDTVALPVADLARKGWAVGHE